MIERLEKWKNFFGLLSRKADVYTADVGGDGQRFCAACRRSEVRVSHVGADGERIVGARTVHEGGDRPHVAI